MRSQLLNYIVTNHRSARDTFRKRIEDRKMRTLGVIDVFRPPAGNFVPPSASQTDYRLPQILLVDIYFELQIRK